MHSHTNHVFITAQYECEKPSAGPADMIKVCDLLYFEDIVWLCIGEKFHLIKMKSLFHLTINFLFSQY